SRLSWMISQRLHNKKDLLPVKRIFLIALLALSGCAANPTSEEAGVYRAVESVWTERIGHGAEGMHLLYTPVIEGDNLYVASVHEISALNRKSGKTLWRHLFDRAINTGAAIAQESLLFGSDAEVVSISKLTGEISWHARVNSEVLATPVVANGLVIVRTVDGNITAHEIDSGKQRWSYQFSVPVLTLRGGASPVIHGGIVYVGTASGHVIALDLQSGELRWDSTLAVAHGRNAIERLVDVDAPLLITKSGIIASAYQQGSMLLTPQSGQIVWKRDFSTVSGTTTDGEQFYFGDLEGSLWSASIARGATYWKQATLEGRELTQPALQADMVLVGDNEGYVHWFSKRDGSKRFSKRVQTRKEQFPIKTSTHGYNQSFNERRAILAPPVVVDEWAYLIDQRGVLEAFRLSK
ncbi:MAG: outer membrane protein assembly factor BamB, partial [Chromatiales bacterium]|nr:outer membrane protein assembly factor BamB [Chromatiales bacterium]